MASTIKNILHKHHTTHEGNATTAPSAGDDLSKSTLPNDNKSNATTGTAVKGDSPNEQYNNFPGTNTKLAAGTQKEVGNNFPGTNPSSW